MLDLNFYKFIVDIIILIGNSDHMVIIRHCDVISLYYIIMEYHGNAIKKLAHCLPLSGESSTMDRPV